MKVRVLCTVCVDVAVDCGSAIGVLKQKELSEFIVSVIKGNANLAPKKKVVEVVTPVDEQVVLEAEVPKDTPVVHEEL